MKTTYYNEKGQLFRFSSRCRQNGDPFSIANILACLCFGGSINRIYSLFPFHILSNIPMETCQNF